MTTHRDPDRLLAAYLADGMEVLPDRVVDAVLAEVHQTNQRAVFGPRRTPLMNSAIKYLLSAAAVVAVAIVGLNVLMPGNGGQSGGPGVASPSPSASPSAQMVQMSVAGTEGDGTGLGLTVELPDGWSLLSPNAMAGDDVSADTMIFVSVVDNTFSDPCASVPRSPKVGSTVDEVATALREIPDTTAAAPTQTTLAEYEATYVELTFSDPMPCDLRSFYLWQDAPGNHWWPQSADETLRTWIVDVGGVPVVVAARTYPQTSDEVMTELEAALDSIVFDTAP